jgi:phosphoenolpyruvate phosphomutase
MIGKSAAFRDLLSAPRVVRMVGAHDGLGARVGERAGFEAIWASGFELAASRGVPDSGIINMSDQLAASNLINLAVRVPVIADCDTGYGDEENAAYAVRCFEAAGIAGICIEDNVFPKINSFAPGEHRLEPAERFASKVAAAKAAQQSGSFVVMARVEALIAGLGVHEALLRAHMYADAGADAVVIHSKKSTARELAAVARRWHSRVPLVAIPTTYYRATASDLAALGVKVVIYANHGLRTAVRAMLGTFREILETGSSATVEPRIAEMREVFELQEPAPSQAVAHPHRSGG